MQKKGLDNAGMDKYMNKECGVLGISGISSDFRDLEDAANKGDEKAQLALDMFCYQVKRYIGAYAAAMGGVDAIVFTAGVGENDIGTRAKVCKGLNSSVLNSTLNATMFAARLRKSARLTAKSKSS